jgi:gas vesicle protein
MPPVASRNSANNNLDGGLLVFGLLVGLVAGGVVGLLNAPRSGRATRSGISQSVNETGESLRQTVESTVERVTPTDPIGESIAEGKAAARRRRAELGLSEIE